MAGLADSPPTGETPDITAAFALGWQVAGLYRPERRTVRTPADGDDLPSVATLDVTDIRVLGVDQVAAGLARLGPAIGAAGLEPPDLATKREQLLSATVDARRQAIVWDLHVELLSLLTAADFRLGKAYGIGQELAESCRPPEPPGEWLRERFAKERVDAARPADR